MSQSFVTRTLTSSIVLEKVGYGVGWAASVPLLDTSGEDKQSEPRRHERTRTSMRCGDLDPPSLPLPTPLTSPSTDWGGEISELGPKPKVFQCIWRRRLGSSHQTPPRGMRESAAHVRQGLITNLARGTSSGRPLCRSPLRWLQSLDASPISAPRRCQHLSVLQAAGHLFVRRARSRHN